MEMLYLLPSFGLLVAGSVAVFMSAWWQVSAKPAFWIWILLILFRAGFMVMGTAAIVSFFSMRAPEMGGETIILLSVAISYVLLATSISMKG